MTVTTRNRLALGLLAGLIVAVVLVYYFTYFSGAGDADSSDPDKRQAAARDLAGKTDEASLKVLSRLSDDPEPRVSITAVRSIVKGREHERNRKALTKILADKARRSVARAAAATALGECPEVNARVLTRAMLVDDDAQVRVGAARGLAVRRDRTTLPQLVQALSDSDNRVRLWAITAIRRTTAKHFRYDAEKPPARQRAEIKIIREAIREMLR